jgi:chemosensory pili system protein ChpA (sensor histidine kinase/response regulator)
VIPFSGKTGRPTGKPMNEAIDYTALNWVRQELNEKLKQARQCLEEFAESNRNPQILESCISSLHEARGPLHMLGLQGAAWLAWEMEAAVKALSEGRLAPTAESLETLMEAFVQLPDYLSRLRGSRCDVPMALLPRINRLRALSGEAPLPEDAIFNPDLTIPVPVECYNSRSLVDVPDVQNLAGTYRQRFQAGLVEWYRTGGIDAGLQKLHEVLTNLQQASKIEAVARLWWFSAALAEALTRGDLTVSTGIKQLFGRIDRQLKRLIDIGESAFSTGIPHDLLRQLLFHILQSDSSAGRVGDIRGIYAPKDSDRRAVSESLAGCSEQLFSNVAAGVGVQIEQIKARLDAFMHAGVGELSELSSIADDMHALGNTVGMIGMEEAGSTLVEQARQLRTRSGNEGGLQESGMTPVANALLAVDAMLREIGTSSADQAESQSTADHVYREGVGIVIREVIADMIGARERIDSYLRMPAARDPLNDVPQLLDRVRGGLLMAGEERAAALVGQVRAFVLRELIGNVQTPGEQQLETFADAVCSIEYYVEELRDGAVYGGMVLDVAQQSLDKLGYSSLTTVPPLPAVEAAATVPSSAVVAVQEVPVISALEVIAADIDREILDIFVEEAGGEVRLLDELIPRVTAGEADGETLETIRRALHTLKGSGRMVGAMALGEFAYVFERLLKQIIDGPASCDEAHRELLRGFGAPLAELLEQVKGGPAPRADVDGLVRRAVGLMVSGIGGFIRPAAAGIDAISPVEDGPTGDDGQESATEPGQVVDAGEPAPPAAGPALPVLTGDADPEIVELFLEEAAEQLGVISGSLAQWLANRGDQEALVTARRAFHTLKGSGRMAGAMVVGEFAWAIEALLHRVIDGAVAVDAELESLLGRLDTPVSELLAQVGGGPAPTCDIRALMVAAQRLARGESSSSRITATAEGSVEVAIPPVADAVEGEGELIEIFIRECHEHLVSIQDFIAEWERGDRDHQVTEPLYRALHTLAGIAESAQVTFIKELAAELYRYFAALEEARQPPGREAVAVLGACAAAISELADRLPDGAYNRTLLESLQERIRALPQVEPQEENVKADSSSDTPQSAPTETMSDSRADPLEAGRKPEAESVAEAAAHTAAAPSSEPKVDSYADIDPELFEVFVEEAGEIIESSEATLHAWIEEPGESELMNEFQRQLHTLKGSARMVNIIPIGDLSHNLETLLTRVVEGQLETSDELFALLRQAHDRLANMLEKVRSREMPEKAQSLMEALKRLGSGDESAKNDKVLDVEPLESGVKAPKPDLPDVALATESESPAHGACVNVPEPALSSEVVEAVITAEASSAVTTTDPAMTPLPERRKVTRARGEQVRVQAELLDNLVNYSGEISIYRSRLEQQIGVYRFNLAELHQTINRVRDQLRQFEIETESQILHRFERESEDPNLDFDPLEMDRYSNLQQLSRSLVESISDLHSIQDLLDNTTRETEALLLQQSRVSTDLQEGLMRARMIPFAGLAPRLRRIVRQAAGELGKQVELTLDGAEGELDRNVIERIVAPLEHMLRNAVDHGIERPEERRAAGKPEAGTVRIAFHREGPEIVLEVADDGRGLNQDAIRERAVERGLLAADAQVTDSEIMQFVLQTGFSTADKVTQISGRGVGMDVVNSEVKQLGGSLLIDSSPGRGSSFTIRLPYTLASNQALLLRAGEDTFCIPLGSIDGVVRVDAAYLAECYRSPEAGYRYAGNLYQLHHLGTLLKRGSMDLDGAQGRIPVLLVRIGEKRLALQVEALIGNREIVIKPLGPQLSSVHGVSGATILGDGRVILILDMAAVARLAVRPQLPTVSAIPHAKQRLLVMVVDDSITVRKVTTRLLERYGFEVLTAKDGVDAMSQLQDRLPDIMLLDIEMPRMDGFELARHVRGDERLRHVPITMITSRTGDKHRERAAQIGVNHYLGKPFQEHELLNTIHRLIGIPVDEAVEGQMA